MLHGLVGGARGGLRPKIPWLTDIAEWTEIGITIRVREAEDRQKWRRLVTSIKCPNWTTKAVTQDGTFSDNHFMITVALR